MGDNLEQPRQRPSEPADRRLRRESAARHRLLRGALGVQTERDFPWDWAETQNNLGVAYQDLPTGDRGDNLRRAIACHEAALRVRTERDFPQDWATTQNNLGVAYQNLPSGDRADNRRRAIACYEAAARGYDAAGLTLSEEAERARTAARDLKTQIEED